MNPCFSSAGSPAPDSTTAWTVRPAQLADTPRLADILTDGFHSSQGLGSWLNPVFRMGIYEDLRTRLRSTQPHYLCLVAVAKASPDRFTPEGAPEVLGGTVELSLRSPLTIPLVSVLAGKALGPYQSPYISNLAVGTEYRRQGIAQLMLSHCERVAWQWGFQDIYLHVLENNPQARPLYEKMGYRLQGPDPTWLESLLGRPQRLLLRKSLITPPDRL